MRKKDITIKKKLIIIIMGVTFVTLVAAIAVQLISSYLSMRADVHKRLQLTADITGTNVASALDFLDPEAANLVLKSLVFENSIMLACLYDSAGNIFALYKKQNTSNGCVEKIQRVDAKNTPGHIHILQEITNENIRQGALFIEYDLRYEHESFFKESLIALIIIACALFAGYLLAYRLQRIITAPLLSLSRTALTVGKEKDYSIRANKHSEDEIGLLVESFNTMIDEIEKRDRELIAAREEADKANMMKGQFLATMSHEIRTPMNGVLGMAELILGARPSLQVEGYANTIINSGESLQQIIDDILDFSKIEAGRLAIDPMPINILNIVDDVAKLYAVKARDKAIELAVRHTPGSEQFIFADPVRIRQVLSNLISNAIKFTEDGHISLIVDEVKHESNDEIACLKFSVTDTGIGLNEEEQARVFEKFRQADNSTTRKYGGTGLGLSICKSLTEIMGGEIGVNSAPGEGATFWFKIPFKRNKDIAYKPVRPEVLKDVRILIVDDLVVIREMVKEQLRNVNVRCEDAVSGENALKKIKEAIDKDDPYQIIIIDYLMPEMNGEMLANAVKKDKTIPPTCLIMLTAAGNPLANDNFVKSGFSAYIAKPVEHHALISNIAHVWEQYKSGKTEEIISTDTGRTQRSKDAEEEPKTPGASILVAEDNLVNQVFIREILEEMETQTTIVSNGKEALEALEEHEYDLIIMDCLMPVMDGFEATGHIQNMIKTGQIRQVPILALTANAMKGDKEKCLAVGMDDYLSKPVRKKELKECVFKHVDVDAYVESEEQKPQEVENIKDQGPSQQHTDILDIESVENARSILKNKYDDMVVIYITNSWEHVEQIAEALDNNDIVAIIRPAHTLKSTSKQMGALKLAELAKQVEYTAKEACSADAANDPETAIKDMTAVMADIRTLLAQTKKAFDNLAA